MDRARFEEGLTIGDYLDRVVARAAEWRAGFERASLSTVDAIPADVVAVVVAEDWSWECAVGLPPILRWLSQVRGLETRVFPRDENLDVAIELDRGDPLAIPKIALFDASGSLVARWGPRALAAERVFSEKEAIRGRSERVMRLRTWYECDRGQAGALEVRALLAHGAPRGAKTP